MLRSSCTTFMESMCLLVRATACPAPAVCTASMSGRISPRTFSVRPMMACSGVRSSWEVLATKTFVNSSRCLADAASAEMSWMTPTKTWPSWPGRYVSLSDSSMVNLQPFFLSACTSRRTPMTGLRKALRPIVSLLFAYLRRYPSCLSRSDSGMRMFTFSPRTSFFFQPNVFSAAGLKSRISPSWPMTIVGSTVVDRMSVTSCQVLSSLLAVASS
mmetsp:Transcript_2350/g.8363  ORF Transcript_2350/g.8363 Transcript_2350/m.8363 type:complete len:215 (-) Transcript_2350:478-1122(-)